MDCRVSGDLVLIPKVSVEGSSSGHRLERGPRVSVCTWKINFRRWQNAPIRSVSKRWRAFVYSVPTRSEAFRLQERHKPQAWAYEPWNDGLLSIVPTAWPASFGRPVKTAGSECCRQKQSN